jgi:hypothetical protein
MNAFPAENYRRSALPKSSRSGSGFSEFAISICDFRAFD